MCYSDLLRGFLYPLNTPEMFKPLRAVGIYNVFDPWIFSGDKPKRGKNGEYDLRSMAPLSIAQVHNREFVAFKVYRHFAPTPERNGTLPAELVKRF